MKTKDLVKNALGTTIKIGGAYAAQELGKMVPVTTLDPMYVDIAKVVIGGLGVPMIAKGKSAAYLNAFGDGFAIEGGLRLANHFLTTTPAGVYGVDNQNYSIMGRDNADYSLMGVRQPASGSFVRAPKSVAHNAM